MAPEKHKSISQEVQQTIERAVGLIAKHPNVVRLSGSRLNEDARSVDVTVDIRLGLPFKWMAEGASPNGVFATESVDLSFPHDYPITAPKVTLRENFDRSLAHVQPGPGDGPVIPCLIAGDLNEFLHANGLMAIVNQLVDWLEKAALNKLIDPSQGWEPIRRDGIVDWIIADEDFLRSHVGKEQQYYFLPFIYLKVVPSVSIDYALKNFVLYGEVGTSKVIVNKKRYPELLDAQQWRNEVMKGCSLAILVTPGKLPSGDLSIADAYTPETITTLSALQSRAEEYGCGTSLKRALSYLSRCANQWNVPAIPVAVILCARRPYPLINESSNIELVPYVIEIQAPKLLPKGDDTPVYPAAHRHAITSTLLRRFSGDPSTPEKRNLTLVGCGSLGSKIAIHLARSGIAPTVVIDNRSMSPHNAARHALLPQPYDMQLTWLGPKAEALASAIEGLRQPVKAFNEDVTRAIYDGRARRRFFPKQTWAVLNATASLRVREALAAIAPEQLKARVIETALFANGAVGLLTVEGVGRNPNSMDLIATTYDLMRMDDQLREIVFEAEDPIQWQSVGQGCGSNTMRISDARISLFAASMTEYIGKMLTKGPPDDGGRVFIGNIASGGMSLSWTETLVTSVHIAHLDNAPGWIARVSEKAHQKILSACAAYPHEETGGIIVGRMSESQRAFLVTDVLPAPEDSRRSAAEFVLGTHGVQEMLDAYTSSCQYALYCLGTWHRHLTSAGPSERDRKTAAQLAMARLAPSLLLIRTEEGYRALIAAS